VADQASGTARVRVIREGVGSYLPDIDPEETGEWLESFDAMLAEAGPQRARYLMLRLLERAGDRRVPLPALTSTDYVNTIPTENEPWFPGDEDTERRYRAWIRWNAAIMVHRAQRPGIGVGGHISTYASSAALYEVGTTALDTAPILGRRGGTGPRSVRSSVGVESRYLMCVPVLISVQPLLPRSPAPRRRRPGLHPGPRLPGHLRPGVPGGKAVRSPT